MTTQELVEYVYNVFVEYAHNASLISSAESILHQYVCPASKYKQRSVVTIRLYPFEIKGSIVWFHVDKSLIRSPGKPLLSSLIDTIRVLGKIKYIVAIQKLKNVCKI